VTFSSIISDHPNEMASAEIEAFLTYLACRSTRWRRRPKIKRSAPCYFCIADVPQAPLDTPHQMLCAPKNPKRLPTVLPKEETLKVIVCLSGPQND